MLYDYELLSGFFLLTMVTGLLGISYWAGIIEIEEIHKKDNTK